MENEKRTLDASQNINLDQTPDVEGNKNELDGKTYNELRKIAKEKGFTFAKNVNKGELINLINNAEQVNANAMSLDNKPISPIVLTNEKEEIPAGFIAVKTKPIMNENKFYNGRGYKVIGNGRAIWCDNGQCFDVNSLNK